MRTEETTPRQALATAISAALNAGASGESLAQLVIRSGWQPRSQQDPDREYLEGLLDNGRHVPIEIRHTRSGQAIRI